MNHKDAYVSKMGKLGHGVRWDDIYLIDSVIERFWKNVRKEDDHWLWTAATDQHGYGCLMVKVQGKPKRMWKAHRVSYLLHHGHLPDGPIVLHECDQPACVKPECLFLGTQIDNIRDMDAKGRRRVGRGEHSRSHKVTDEQVREIRRRFAQGEHYLTLSNAYGISNQSMYAIVKRQTWRHVI